MVVVEGSVGEEVDSADFVVAARPVYAYGDAEEEEESARALLSAASERWAIL